MRGRPLVERTRGGKRLRWDGLGADVRERFLQGLIQTRSVTRAALFAGKRGASAFYQLRQRDPQFAARWDETLANVVASMEAELTERAVADMEQAEAASLKPLDFDETMRLLWYFRARNKGAKKFGRPMTYATPEETDAALMERLDMLEARVRARKAKERAARKAARGLACAKVQQAFRSTGSRERAHHSCHPGLVPGSTKPPR
jgi:Pyruvate/2-oxoacid:ferredoxin oxidoreductase gamma subunit